MLKPSRTLIGMIVLIAASWVGFKLISGYYQAIARDNFMQASITEGECVYPAFNIVIATRTMSERESQAVAVVLSDLTGKGCEAAVEISAPDFEVRPAEPHRTVTLPAGQRSVSSIWVVSPKVSGTFEIAISPGVQTKVIGITVTDVWT